MASISIDDTGVGRVKHDVGERGDSNVTPVKDNPFRATVEYVARVSEEVPRDAPEGRIVEKMAGEDVPKLINAAEDSRTVLELIALRLTVRDPGMPEVVRTDEAAVAAILEETTWMLVEPVMGDRGRPGVVVSAVDVTEVRSGPRPLDRETGEPTVAISEDVAERSGPRPLDRERGEPTADVSEGVAEDKSGPRPLDREMGEPTVAITDASDVVEGSTVMALDNALKVGKVPVNVEVPPPRADTTAGVDSVPIFSLDTDRSGFWASASMRGRREVTAGHIYRTHRQPRW